MGCGWWIFIHFVCFLSLHGLLLVVLVTCIIDSRQKCDVLNFVIDRRSDHTLQVLTTLNIRPRNKALSSAERLLGTAVKTNKCSTARIGP